MAIVDKSIFKNSNGWTIISTSTPITFGIAEGSRTYVRHRKLVLGFNDKGIYRTAGHIIHPGHVIYFDMRIIGNPAHLCAGGLSPIPGITLFSEPGAAAVNILGGTNFDLLNGTGLPGPVYTENIWYNVRHTINENGSVTMNIREDDGQRAWDISEEDWTTGGVYTDTTISPGSETPDYSDEPEIRFFTNLQSGQVALDLSRYYWTDDGSVD